VKFDRVALVPASLLPFGVHWTLLGNDLPHGEILIVLPDHAKQQRVVRSVVAQLRETGRGVRIMVKKRKRSAQ
jgi:hypothetical protein